MDSEIKRQLAEFNEKNTEEIDAMVLWVLYSEFGFGKKRLRKFYDIFDRTMKELVEHYKMNNSDTAWLCARKLKDHTGIDISEWSKED